MKKISIFIFYIVILTAGVPTLAVHIFKQVPQIKEEKKLSYDYISVYKTLTDKITVINLEEYIKGVTYAEMPASFSFEALKAQAVAARTYTYKKMGQNAHTQGDMCDDFAHCQAYRESDGSKNWERVSEAVEQTRGEVITYNGEIINAVFHSSSGGMTENSAEVWSGGQLPYLLAVESLGESEIMETFETKKEFDKKEFERKIKEAENKVKYNADKDKIEIIEKTSGGRVAKIKIGNKIFEGSKIREIFQLRSTNFKIEVKKEKVEVTVWGYGHGVGLSQWGAEAMARNGSTYIDILKHYYTGVEITQSVG